MPLESLQNGRYLSIRQLGRGSMGEVYLVEDTVIGRKVAIKLMLADPIGYPDTEAVQDAVKLFKREAQAIARLEHPNILPLYDFGEEKQDKTVFTYMVMPHCQGGSLIDWLSQHYPQEPLPPAEVAYFVERASEALQYAHDHGVIHQDVKPSNFLLRTHTQGQSHPDLLLADFGIARMSSGTVGNTTHFGPRGTPRYMPPEQWEGKPVPASDQYALAIMAYQLLTRQFPFQGEQMHQVMYQHCFTKPEPPSKLNPHISPALDAVILRALAKKPEERFPSVQAFATALSQADQPPAQPGQSAQNMSDALTGPTFNTSGPTLTQHEEPSLPLRQPAPLTPVPPSPNASFTVTSDKPGQITPGPMVLPTYSLPPNPEARTIADQAGTRFPQQPGPTTSPAPTVQPQPPVRYNPEARDQAGTRFPQQPGPTASPAPTVQPQPPVRYNPEARVVPDQAGPRFTQPAAHYAPKGPEHTLPPVYQIPARPARRSSGGKIALFTSLILILVFAGGGLAWWYFTHINNPVNNPDLNSYTSSMPRLRYYDPLTQDTHWQNNPDDGATDGYCLFQQNAYHVSSNIALTYTLCPVKQQPVVSDFTFEVQMQIQHGNCGGMAFRGNYQETAGMFYYFDVCWDGRHYLATYTHFGLIQELKTSPTPFPDIQNNSHTTVTMAIVTQGNLLTFYLNHQQIDQITDSTYSSGQITFLCYEVKDPTDVAFSNARLWTA